MTPFQQTRAFENFQEEDPRNRTPPRKQIYEQRIKKSEDHISSMQAKDEASFKGLKESLAKMVDILQHEQQARDLMDEKKTKEVKLTENNMLIELNIEKQNRRESEAKISKIIDERLYAIRLDLAKEKKIREEAQH
jgi:hypothetical protein